MIPLAFLILVGGAPDMSQTALNGRATSDFTRADAAMNVQYRETMAAMKKMDGLNEPDAKSGPSYQEALLAAQRAWLTFRDAECVTEGYQFRGGSAQNETVVSCQTTLTRTRTAQLKMLSQ